MPWASHGWLLIARCAALDFLDCSGDSFSPAWEQFRAELPDVLTPDTLLSDGLASQAADLLDAAEELNWAEAVSAFSGRLRGELATEDLGDFCLYGLVTAYAVVAYHMARTAEDQLPGSAKNFLARALMILAKKQVNDFLESSSWPIRSLDLVALLELEDFAKVRSLRLHLPCWLRLDCMDTLPEARSLDPPLPPLAAAWPRRVVAVGLHTTSTLEADAVTESWGRGGAAGLAPKGPG
ncbi:unnamed protein product [Effrenium voratum]|nr:unnamed protein product [Effrenium voratum]